MVSIVNPPQTAKIHRTEPIPPGEKNDASPIFDASNNVNIVIVT